jgi:hypothetical protein
VPLDRVLRASIAAVRAALEVARGQRGVPLTQEVVAYEEAAGETELAISLRAWIASR